MKKIVLIAVFLLSSISYAQMTKEDFQKNYINVKSVFIYADGLKESHKKEVLQIKEVNVSYRDSGISISTNSGRHYYVPYNSIQWVEFFADEDRLRLYLKD